MKKFLLFVIFPLLLAMSMSCATNIVAQQAIRAEEAGKWDQAVVYYTEAIRERPNNINLKLRLESVRRQASQGHLRKAREFWEEKRYEDSLLDYRAATELDKLNRQALTEFKMRLDDLRRMQNKARKKDEWELLKKEEIELLEKAAEERPVININSKAKQKFFFPDREIGEIYQALSKLAGMNIIYHDSVRQKLRQKTDFIIENATFWEAFDFFVTTNNHFYRMLKQDTIMIIDGSPNNRRNYEDKVVKVFYLSNADVRDVFTAVRGMTQGNTGMRALQLREQNAIVVKDTPRRVAFIAKLIRVLDKPKAEVIIDVEFIEAESALLYDVGALLSAYSVSQSFVNPNPLGTQANVVRMTDLRAINRTNLFLSIPDVVYNFLKTSSRTRLLAKPQLRITEGEKSTLHIGARVPVRKTTFNPNQASGIGIPVDSYEYESIGIKFTMTPRVHHNNEVSLEMEIELSAIGAGADSTNPTFTTRSIKSKLRLRNGETTLLAGLIRKEEKLDVQGVAGLSDIPLIGKLFSKSQLQGINTDIIITITPHIVMGGLITREDLMALKVGPDINPGFEGLITMEELMSQRYLRGIPISGGSGSMRSDYQDDFDDDYYYYDEDDEYYYDEDDDG